MPSQKSKTDSPVIGFFSKKKISEKIRVNFYLEDYTLKGDEYIDRAIIDFDNWGLLISPHLDLLLKIIGRRDRLVTIAEVENPFTV